MSPLPKLLASDGSAHVLADFSDWKKCVNANYACLLGDDAMLFHGTLTTTTRLAPTVDWSLATAKWHLRRALKQVAKLDFKEVRVMTDTFLGNLFWTYSAIGAFAYGRHQLTVEAWEAGAYLCEGLAIGEIDKQKTSGFLA